MRSRRQAKSTIEHPDLSKVETRVSVKDGDYHVKVSDVTLEQGTEYPYLKWKFRIEGPECEGGVVYNNTSYSPNSLWNLKQLLLTLGQEIPSGPGQIDPEELVGLDLQITVENETFEGKQYPRVTDFSEYEAPTGKDKKASSNGKEAQPVSSDDINDMSQDELEEIVEELDLNVDIASLRTLRKMRAAVIDAAEKAGSLAD